MTPGDPAPDPKSTNIPAKKMRLEAIAEGKRVPMVRVVPASEEIRRVLRHPRGMAFRSSGSVEWPRDKLTERWLRDGSITTEES